MKMTFSLVVKCDGGVFTRSWFDMQTYGECWDNEMVWNVSLSVCVSAAGGEHRQWQYLSWSVVWRHQPVSLMHYSEFCCWNSFQEQSVSSSNDSVNSAFNYWWFHTSVRPKHVLINITFQIVSQAKQSTKMCLRLKWWTESV